MNEIDSMIQEEKMEEKTDTTTPAHQHDLRASLFDPTRPGRMVT